VAPRRDGLGDVLRVFLVGERPFPSLAGDGALAAGVLFPEYDMSCVLFFRAFSGPFRPSKECLPAPRDGDRFAVAERW
jgi:hypothetical protein